MAISSLLVKVVNITVLLIATSVHGYHQDTVIDAKKKGMYEAIISWNKNGYGCSNVNQFKEVIHRGVYKQCETLYASNLRIKNYSSLGDQLISACKNGAEEVYEEKIHQCNHHNCEESGTILAGPVTAILCRFVHSPWSVEPIPESCVPKSESSCIGKGITDINKMVEAQECKDMIPIVQRNALYNEVKHLCDSFIHAYSTDFMKV